MSETPKMYRVTMFTAAATITRIMSEDQLKKLRSAAANVQRRFVPVEGYDDILGAENTPETVINANEVCVYLVREVEVKDESKD